MLLTLGIAYLLTAISVCALFYGHYKTGWVIAILSGALWPVLVVYVALD